jgi:phenylalanyl-tRNA synthetase beta chain
VELSVAKGIFERLGCEVSVQGDALAAALPTHRPDLSREIDLIEEYARVRGYDTIPTQLPALHASSEGTAAEITFVRRIREAAAALGLCEAVNFAFVAPADLEKARVPTHTLRLANPLSEERLVLRTALLPGLLQNLMGTQRHAQKRLAHFEIAHVFSARAVGELPDERYQLGVLLWGHRKAWYDERDVLDFYDGKGVLQSLTQRLCGLGCETVPNAGLDERAPFLHPKRRASVVLGGRSVGVLGELHPDVCEAHDLLGRPVYAAVEVRELLAACQAVGVRRASALPKFPAATRDLAVVVAEGLAAGEVEGSLHQAAGDLCESVRLFDIYRGAPVPDDHKSLAFHVVYRDPKGTLTDKLVDETHAKLTASAEQQFGASVRK